MTTGFEDRFFLGPDDDPDRYEVVELVGGGGEGKVSQARFALEGTWQVVAVKTLDAPAADHVDWAATRLRTQVDLLRLLSDPGVVGVHDGFVGPVAHRQGQAAGRPRTLHLVMNWVEGRSLVKWRDELSGPGAFHDVAKVLQQIATSLDYLASGSDTNGQSVVHGDIKPGNVIVTNAGQARLVDFGLARLAHAATTAPAGGTKGYLAPEVAASGQFSPASDRYALGGVAYYLFTGEDPPGNYDLEGIRARLRAAPMLEGRPALAEHLVQMLAADPAARPTQATAWARQFGLTSTTIDPSHLATTPGGVGHDTRRSRPRSRSRKVPAVVAVVLALLVTGTAATFALTRNPDGGAAPSPTTATPVAARDSTSAPTSTAANPNTTAVASGSPTSSSAVAGGGVSRPPSTANAPLGQVVRQGPLVITARHCVDLDSAAPDWDVGDSCGEDGDLNVSYSGQRLSHGRNPGFGPVLEEAAPDAFETCQSHTVLFNAMDVKEAVAAGRLCLRTTAGNHALLFVRAATEGSHAPVSFDVVVWKGTPPPR